MQYFGEKKYIKLYRSAVLPGILKNIFVKSKNFDEMFS